MPTPLSTLTTHLNTLAPPHLAEPWDNTGLLAGTPSQPIQNVLLAIDLTRAVYDETLATNTNLLITYHPPFFKAFKSLVPTNSEPQSLALQLAAKGIAIYSPHTALDIAPAGTNDALAEAIGATVTGSLTIAPAKTTYLKLVTFIPEPDVEKVADALFAAGCGHIGEKSKYTRCSFRTPGTGTFQGDKSTNPAVGTAEHYEKVPEIRFETILPSHLATDVITALRSVHPYEEPAFDLLQMHTPPSPLGLGRIATLPKPLALKTLAQAIQQSLRLPHLSIVPALPARPIKTLALVAGSAGRIALDHHISRGKPRFAALLTGELKHHDQLAYAAAGIPAILLGHAESERPVLRILAKSLRKGFPKLSVSIAKADKSIAQTL